MCLGEIVAAHGIKGEVKIRTFTEDPMDLLSYGPLVLSDASPISVHLGIQKSASSVLGKLDGCTTRNQAETHIGTKLFIHRSQLPHLDEGEYYHDDLVGMTVFDDKGQKVGTVDALQNFGAGDFLEISSTETTKPITAIFSDDSVVSVSVDDRKIVIREGFLLV